MRKLIADQSTADVTFVVGNEQFGKCREYKVHRAIISVISEVFKAMLYGRMKESKKDAIITINDIKNGDSFESIVNFAYCNNPKISIKNLIEVRYLCEKYQINSLANACDKYFISNLNNDNFGILFDQIREYKLESLSTQCKNALNNGKINLSKVFESQKFLNVSLNMLIFMLESDKLEMSEEKIWDRILSWHEKNWNQSQNISIFQQENEIKYDDYKQNVNSNDDTSVETQNNIDATKKLELLTELKKYIRFPLMSGEYFIENVMNKCPNLLTKDEIISVLVYIQLKSSKKYQSKKKDLKCLFNTTDRKGGKEWRLRHERTINRCDFSKIGSSWSYGSGKQDALKICVSQDAYLNGVGIWCGNGTTKVKMKILVDDNDSNVVAEFEQKTFTFSDKQKKPTRFDFHEPVLLKKGKLYSIVATINGPNSYSCQMTNAVVKFGKDQGVTMKFSQSNKSTNNTDTSTGQFPSFYVTTL